MDFHWFWLISIDSYEIWLISKDFERYSSILIVFICFCLILTLPISPDLNLGYGKANNLGVNKSKTPYILIVNPDILLNEQLINTLYSEFLNYNDDVGVIGPSLYDSNMKRRTNGSISHVKKIKGRKLSNSLNNIPENNMCCDFLVGCCLFMRRDFFIELGGFDKDFFMYFEDNDLCDRIIKKGKTVVEVPLAKVIH